ncbi:ribonuclease HII [Mycoplasmopsis cricetuli]|uniref:ribonuclease HII n=1 Tax=Mycoplasmopsis cricetuli TaxID=171283 RepID=UPI0004712DF0|nr:ribonuclease HII [Mycoplasmopsis cricetuli]
MLTYEKNKLKQYKLIAGCDEAGRGAWAGPLVAACVIMPKSKIIKEVNDSKKLSVKTRKKIYDQILNYAIEIQISIVEVDQLNISNPKKESINAMSNCVKKFKKTPEIIITDFEIINTDLPQINLIKGDQISYNVAAASIMAKVFRDNLMVELSHKFPNYGFEQHKGYGTIFHKKQLKKYGITSIHRRKYKPIQKIILDNLDI